MMDRIHATLRFRIISSSIFVVGLAAGVRRSSAAPAPPHRGLRAGGKIGKLPCSYCFHFTPLILHFDP
ncbi:hypothetical protein SEVIR_5G413450v4 [Setaria viridis]